MCGKDPPAKGGPPSIGRLKKRSEFIAAATGRRFHTERMTVQALLREDTQSALPRLRYGLTVTKRVGHATERNRIRRRLRAAIRAVAPRYAGPALDVVVIGRRDILHAPYETLLDDLHRGLAAVAKPKSAGKAAVKGVPSWSLSSSGGERRRSPDA